MSDFTFGDIADEIPVGTRIDVVDEVENELHEFGTWLLADDDDRDVGEVICDAGPPLTGGPPVAVLLATLAANRRRDPRRNPDRARSSRRRR